MPKRPRQHVVEDASRRAFEGVLPEEWVYRTLSHDYGIDGEVEIFSEGEATGLTFKVQLKGTDAARTLAVRLPHDKAAYYGSLSEPVLIVLHHGPTGRVFARWFQSYDPHDEPPGEKAITLRFGDEHELIRSSSDRLRFDVETHWRLRDHHRALPITLALQRTSETVARASTVAVALALRDAAAGYGDIISLSAIPSGEEMGAVVLQQSAVLVTCRSLASATVHYQDPWPDTPSVDLVLHDTLVMLGVLLERIGQSAAAARLLRDYASGSSVARNPDALISIVQSLGRNHQLAEAIALAEKATDEAANDKVRLLLSVMWTALGDALTPDDRQAVVDHLLRRADQAESGGDTRQSAIEHYNVGNKLRGLGRHDEALLHFRRAAELDPTYPQRDYFAGEIAGSLFETGDYEAATEMYREAVERGRRERYLPLLADALLMSGQYVRAHETFTQVMSESILSRSPSEWRLKLRVLDRILGLVGESQLRDAKRAMVLADVSSPELSDDKRRRSLEDALHADALCPLAWFNLGLLESNTDNVESAFISFLAAGVLSRIDLEAFARALFAGLVLGEPLTIDVVRSAYFFNGSRFIHFLVNDVISPESEAHDALLEFVEEILAEDSPEKDLGESLELRFVDEHGAYESMEIRFGAHPSPPEANESPG